MRHYYDIPDVTYRRSRQWIKLTICAVVTALLILRHAYYLDSWVSYRLITVIWTVAFVTVALQWVISWLERPYTTTPAQQQRLDKLRVTVNIPVYNEEPVVLDRVLYSLFSQTRMPDRVEVVDDGSTKDDYADVRDWWLRHHPPQIEFSWIRQKNAGKKRAQARTFATDPTADVFVTLDSDTTLAPNAIDEGIKPFTSRQVHSVAGIELAWNHSHSLLTRIKSVNALIWQFTVCSAQNAMGGSVLVNRGTFALYRGQMIRDNLAAYVGETLFGVPVMLGDDTMLTLFALAQGKAVQQPTAACFAMYPETFSHTFRQWVRWMRGTSIRTLWRLRYLPLYSWGWWYTLLTTWGYLSFISVIVASLTDWPHSRTFVLALLYISIAWTWITASRMFAVRRSDQNRAHRIEAFMLVPAAYAWMTFILRPIRVYGQLTMLQQGWVTRQHGAVSTASEN